MFSRTKSVLPGTVGQNRIAINSESVTEDNLSSDRASTFFNELPRLVLVVEPLSPENC